MTNDFYKNILDKNRAWVESKLDLDPDFFNKLAQGLNFLQKSGQISLAPMLRF